MLKTTHTISHSVSLVIIQKYAYMRLHRLLRLKDVKISQKKNNNNQKLLSVEF